MKLHIKPNHLKFAISGAGIAALLLRAALYATAVDGRGLLVQNHPLSITLWILTTAVAAALVFGCRTISGSSSYADAHGVSFAAFLGCLAAAAGIALAQWHSFGAFATVLDIFIWMLGLAAAVAFVCIGLSRLMGAKPYFLLHVLICLFFALRLVSQYRLWSSDPQLPDYVFYLMAHLALMLTAYHQAAFDAGMGSHRGLWVCALAGVYLSCAAIYGCAEPLLMVGCALWCVTNLTNLTVHTRRTRPTLKLDDDLQGE